MAQCKTAVTPSLTHCSYCSVALSPWYVDILPEMKWNETCGDRIILVQHSQYHGCWCPGSLRHQDISTHDIDHVEQVIYCLTWGNISITCVMSVWRNDKNCSYMFVSNKKFSMWRVNQPLYGFMQDLGALKYPKGVHPCHDIHLSIFWQTVTQSRPMVALNQRPW